jgi:hypothetical protein
MVRHDMAAAKAKLTSEQIRIAQGLLTPAERAAKAKAEAEKAERTAKEQANGVPLFGGQS